MCLHFEITSKVDCIKYMISYWRLRTHQSMPSARIAHRTIEQYMCIVTLKNKLIAIHYQMTCAMCLSAIGLTGYTLS